VTDNNDARWKPEINRNSVVINVYAKHPLKLLYQSVVCTHITTGDPLKDTHKIVYLRILPKIFDETLLLINFHLDSADSSVTVHEDFLPQYFMSFEEHLPIRVNPYR